MISLAQGNEELWCSQNSCLSGIQKMLKFHVVGELSCWGHKLEIDVPDFIPFCYWKGAKFM